MWKWFKPAEQQPRTEWRAVDEPLLWGVVRQAGEYVEIQEHQKYVDFCSGKVKWEPVVYEGIHGHPFTWKRIISRTEFWEMRNTLEPE